IVQEALTNTLKHGGANPRAWVTIEYRGEAVELRIDDAGAGARTEPLPARGQGLVGMRERAAVYGGSLLTGERPGGGFRGGAAAALAAAWQVRRPRRRPTP